MLESMKNKTKYGFSLFEVCVTMAIVVIFIAACSNVFTTRHKKQLANPIHGHYECYRDEYGSVYWQTFNENGPVGPRDGGSPDDVCVFTPPKSASFLTINAVAAGGTGGDIYGGTAGEFANMFLSATNETIFMVPGHSAPASDDDKVTGSPTTLSVHQKVNPDGSKGGYELDGFGNLVNPFIYLKGGRNGKNKDVSFKSCSVVSSKYVCPISPVCNLKPNAFDGKGGIELGFCYKNFNDNGEGANAAPSAYYRFETIPYYSNTNVSVPGNWWYNPSYCTKTTDSGTNDARAYNRLIYPICDDNKCGYDDMGTTSTSLFTYVFKRQICDSYSNVNPSEIDYITVNLMFDGNYTKYADSTDMNGLVNSLGLIEGIAAKKDCYNPDTKKDNDAKCRVSTGDGAPIKSRGGHGSVLISW